MTTEEMIVAFHAKGGKVRKVAPTATCGMSDRDWYKAARDDTKARVIVDDTDDVQREEIAREAFGAARLNGASMSDALDDYNHARKGR